MLKIGPGVKVGKLIVEEATEERKSGYTVWKCRCECGGQRLLDTRQLQRGTIRDCGCDSQVKPGQNDLTGRRFGRLVACRPTEQRGNGGEVLWLCRCDCGKQVAVSGVRLVRGDKKSCGCLRHPQLKQLKGRRFGRLVVTAYAGKQAGMHQWLCRCDCGKETVVGQTRLESGKTRSCGCLQAGSIRENLKLIDGTSVTRLEAGKKGKRVKSNTSGHTGVYWNRRTSSWAAQITFQGKTYYLGSYQDIEDAIKARKRGEEMHENFLEWYYENQASELTCQLAGEPLQNQKGKNSNENATNHTGKKENGKIKE